MRELAGAIPALDNGVAEASQIHFPWAAPLRVDWATQGDEVGRYGSLCGILCAADGIADNYLVRARNIKIHPMLGPHAMEGDGLRRWLQRVRSNNLRCLYAPWQGSRIDSSWDDHGEVYPHSFSGPNIAVAVALPGGNAVYRLSLYFWNDDGHVGINRQRDLLVQIFPLPKRLWHAITPPPREVQILPHNEAADAWMAHADQTVPLAEGRAVQFSGGAYLQFALSGPGDYMVCIRRNHSLNAAIAGFFLDPLTGGARPAHGTPHSAWLPGLAYRPPNCQVTGVDERLSAAVTLWRKARSAILRPWLAQLAEPAAYRYACASGAPAALLTRWRWRMDIWTAADRRRFDSAMAENFARLRTHLASQSALFKAMAAARKKGSRHFVWRGSWANPVKAK